MGIQRDKDTGKFVSATSEPPEHSITSVLADHAAATAVAEPPPELEKKVEPSPKKDNGKALENQAVQFLNDFVDEKSLVSKEKKEPAKKKAEPAKAAPAKAKPAAVAPPAPLTAEQIAAAAAEGVARGMQPKKEEKTEPVLPELPPVEQRKFTILSQMEKLYPDRYKGISDRYRASMVKLKEYAEKWEKEHPGEEFDQDAEEHKAFFDANDVDWQDEDYTEAIADLRADAKLQEERKITNGELSELKRKERLRESAPAVAREQTSAARDLWKLLGPEFADIVGEDGAVNQMKLAELQTKDPIATAYRIGAARDLNTEVAEIYKLLNQLAPYDAKNPVHVAMGQFAEQMEREFVAKPAEDKADAQGRSFLPAEAYYQLPKDKREASHWTFSARDLSALRASRIAKETRAFIKAEEEKLTKFAESRGYKLNSSAARPQQQAVAEPDDDPDELPSKPASPGSGGESRLAAVRTNGARGAATAGKSFFTDL